MKSYFILFFILTLAVACEDPVVPVMDPDCNPNPCAEDACEPELCNSDTTTVDEEPSVSVIYNMKVLWKSDLPSYGYWHNYIVTDQFILTNLSEADGYQISCLSKETGELLWTFSDPIVDRFSDLHFHQPTQTVIAQRWGTVVALDGATGDILSKNQVGSFSRTGTLGKLLGDYYYVPVKSLDKTEGGAIRSHVSNLQTWNWIYKMHIDSMDGIEPDADSFNHWYHPETGDEILVLQHRMAFPTRRIDLLAYNLTADSILWWHKDVDPNGNSNIQQTNIFDDKVVFFSARLVHCVDLPSGEILWQSKLNENENRNFILASAEQVGENTVVIANESSSSQPPFGALYLSFVDFSNGRVINELIGERPVHIIAFNHLLFMSGKKRCYDLGSNKFLWDTNIEEIYHGLGHTLVDFDRKVYYAAFPGPNQAYFGAWEIPDEWFD